MSVKPVEMDASYLLAKREKLLKLRRELEQLANAAEAEEAHIRAEAPREAREYEEDAEEMDLLERQGLLVNRSVERLLQVDRALAKIANGTYGYSDESGERIPEERLESMPEATTTLREQEIAEREARSPFGSRANPMPKVPP
jgi:DnaK suppressor protein